MAVHKAQGTVTVSNFKGLHARPSMEILDKANEFHDTNITISYLHPRQGLKVVDAKSIMQLLTLEAIQGAELTISAEGEDAAAACIALVDVINSFKAKEEQEEACSEHNS